MVPDFPTKINPSELTKLSKYAKNRIFEPFEGQRSVDQLQQAKESLESAVEGVTDRLTGSSWFKKGKQAIGKIKDGLSESYEHGLLGDLVEKVGEGAEKVGQGALKVGQGALKVGEGATKVGEAGLDVFERIQGVVDFFGSDDEALDEMTDLIDSMHSGEGVAETLQQVIANEIGETAIEEALEGGALGKGLGRLRHTIEEVAGGAAEQVGNMAKEGMEKIRSMTLDFSEKAFGMILKEDMPGWILPKAKEILGRDDLKQLDHLQALSDEERAKLTEALYPYASAKLSQGIRAFEVTSNLGLGGVVATNLPGTGALVALVNAVKTMVKLANRLNVISAIHGREIASKEALFLVSGKILASLDSFEGAKEHKPLDPEEIAELYQGGQGAVEQSTDAQAPKKEGFSAMVKEAFKKDAYIALPGVGMISLGKIQIDDGKIDLTVRHLVEDYHLRLEMTEKMGEETFERVTADLEAIYAAFADLEYYQSYRKALSEGAKAEGGKGLKSLVSGLKKLSLGDDLQDRLQGDLARFVGELYQAATPEELADSSWLHEEAKKKMNV